MRLIGHRWKCGNVCRLMILIGRGLDLKAGFRKKIKKTKEKTKCLTKVKHFTVQF